MMFPIIKVKDKHSGHEHIVGTNSHDTLYVGEDGQIHYYNLQNGGGTGNGDEYSYSFTGEVEEDEECGEIFYSSPQVEFVSFDELLEIIKKDAEISTENERKMREFVKKAYKDFDSEVEQNKADGIFHT